MKKKILTLVVFAFVFSFIFVLSIGAQQINKDTTVTLSGSYTDANGTAVTTVNLYDADGDALTWYLNTENKVVSAKTADVIVVSSEGEASFKDLSIFPSGVSGKGVLVMNMRDNLHGSNGENYDGQVKTFHSEYVNSDSNHFQFGGYNVSGRVIQYFYFPTSATRLADRMFQKTPIIVADILPGTNITTFGIHSFHETKSLREIFIPNDIQSFHYEKDAGMFTRCENLEKVTFEENSCLTDAGAYTFYHCKSLKELYLPNSVKTAGNRFVQYCTSLEVLSLGASFENFEYAISEDMWFTYGNNKLKKIYLPATIDVEQYTAGGWKQIFDSANNTYTIYFAGNEAQFVTILNALKTAGTNGNIVNAYENDRVEYVTVCEAFYNGVHLTGETAVEKFLGEDYTSDFASVCACARQCGKETVTTICGPLFVNKGYAKELDGSSFTYGITVNKANIATYVAQTGKTFNYGFIVGSVPETPNGNIINNAGEAQIENSVIVSLSQMTGNNFTVFNIKMLGLTEAQKTLQVYCCAYIIDGTAVSYVGNSVTTEASAVCSNDITTLEATTPQTNDENA